jgi:hypothetical protein
MNIRDKFFGGMEKKFHYPYSEDITIKKDQVWENLQTGLLFENNLTFLPWTLTYDNLNMYQIKKTESGDRTIWYLGERKILDGMTCHVEVFKWATQFNFSEIKGIEENLGYDKDGHERFHSGISHLTTLLGLPTTKELDKFGEFDLGVVAWAKGNAKISLVGIEHFNCRYNLYIGLADKEEN